MDQPDKYTRHKVEYFNRDKRLVVLGVTFMATLDKKKYFQKHISLYCHVKSDEVLDRLERVQIGSEIAADVYSDLVDHCGNFLNNFYLIEPE